MLVAAKRATVVVAMILGLAASEGCRGQQEEPLSPSPPQIKVVPGTTTLGIGQSVQFTVEVRNLSTNVEFFWRTTNEGVVRVSASGEATGASKGRAFILAVLIADTSMTARAEVIVE